MPPSNSVKTNRYPFPSGYQRIAQPGSYVPWNGGGVNPGSFNLGAALDQQVNAVPSDLQTIQLSAPNGQQLVFQFVYNTSTQTQGIKIQLPNSGSSTAAQVATAMQAVMGLAGGTPLNGTFQTFPWTSTPATSTKIRLNFTVAGPLTSYAYPANITATLFAQAGGTFQGPVIAASLGGKMFATLPG